jgi:hypothetical protein
MPGLYLCGASTVSHGVLGATVSGLIAAREILHLRISELLRQKGPPLVTLPAEHPELWPERLRPRTTGYPRSIEMTARGWGVQGGASSPLVEVPKAPDRQNDHGSTMVNPEERRS